MNRFINIPFILITIFFLSFAPTKSEAKDCSQYQLLSHKWNKCKLGLTKSEKLDPIKKLEEKDDEVKVEPEAEKKALVKSKKVDDLNEDCSQYQLLSHKWNKCKLGLTKLKKLNPFKKLKRKDDKDKVNVEPDTEKKVLVKSKKIDELNEKCKTLVDCIFPKKKKE